jgi:hypothetical protein
MTIARGLFVAALLASLPAAAQDEARCLSQGEVKGGHPRYHIVGGRQCWHAAASPTARPSAAKPAPAADAIDVNPYGDPIWEQSVHTAARKPRRAKSSAVGGPLILIPPSTAFAR